MRLPKKIFLRQGCESLLALAEMGKVRIIKEHTNDGPVYFAVSASGAPIGIIGERYKYMFENLLLEKGSGDGLFDGCSQTSRASS